MGTIKSDNLIPSTKSSRRFTVPFVALKELQSVNKNISLGALQSLQSFFAFVSYVCLLLIHIFVPSIKQYCPFTILSNPTTLIFRTLTLRCKFHPQ